MVSFYRHAALIGFVLAVFTDWPISLSTTGYIIAIVFLRILILTFNTLRSVKQMAFSYCIVKFLLFSKPFSSVIPLKIVQISL